jgi:hypothetical protein
MTTSGQDDPREQHFHGPGSFGGDNHGTVNNSVLVDPKTRVTLAKLGKSAPALEHLLERALREGVISPDIVDMLQLVVQHISMDVAEDLAFAARHINEDVAINFKGVAREFIDVNQELGERTRELRAAEESFRDMIRETHADAVTFPPAGGMTAPPAPRSPDKWQVRFGLICCSFAVGLTAAMILIRFHHEGYAMLAVAAMVVSAILLLSKARQAHNGPRFPGPPRPRRPGR